MLIISWGLGIIGLLMIYLEFFVPGVIFGVLGGLSLLGGFAFIFWEHSFLYAGLVYLIGMSVLVILTIRFALWRITKTQDKSHFYLGKDQEGFVASSFEKELIGSNGTALTDLKPSGHVEINGNPYQAVSESSYVKKGSKIKVSSGEGARLIVKEVKE